MSDHPILLIAAEYLTHAPTLGAIARTCKKFAEYIRSHVMPHLVGQRNYELLSRITESYPPRTTYLDLRYFWRTVRCTDELPRIAALLHTQFSNDVCQISRGKDYCYDGSIGSIIAY